MGPTPFLTLLSNTLVSLLALAVPVTVIAIGVAVGLRLNGKKE